jgi:hypothetical protein
MRPASAEIGSFIEHWARAELRADVSGLRHLLHDAFVGVTPRGRILDKPAWLQRYRAGDLVNQVFSWRTLDVRASRDTLLVVGQLDQISSYDGRDASASLTATLTVVTSGSHRQLLGFHANDPSGSAVELGF